MGMGGNDVGRAPSPLPPSPTVRTISDAYAVLKSGADIGHRQFEDLELEDIEAVQSLFSGVVFRRCTLRKCNFSRTDFEGARFERCKIYDTNFNHADIRSTTFVECDLSRNTLDDAHIADTLFLRSTLASTSFRSSTLLSNTFKNSTLNALSNNQATILHTDFAETRFDDVTLADCTALFSFFENCKFDRFTINVDALGLTYGLTPTDLIDVKLLFLGKEQGWPDAIDAGEAVIQTFQARQWPLHLAFSRLCYSNIPRADAWKFIFDVVTTQIQLRRGVTIDEVQFVARIAKRLAEVRRLPFAAVIYGYDRLNQLSFEGEDPTAERRSAALLLDELTLLLAKMRDGLVIESAEVLSVPFADSMIAEFNFVERPTTEPGPYLEAIAEIGQPSIVRLLPGRAGSWVQPLQLTGEILFSIFVALYLLEGCIVRLTRIRARANVLFSPTLPAPYLEMANSPKHEMSATLAKTMLSLYGSYIGNDLPAPPREADLTSDKLTHIHLIEHSSPSKASRSKKKQSL
jgi:hypothetical protein